MLPATGLTISSSLKESVYRSVEENGAFVVEFAERGSSGEPLYEVFVDSEDGVTVDACRTLSRIIQAIIDREQVRYKLVVSSPGADRPLRFPWQYRKHIGRGLTLKVKGREEEISGTLHSVDPDSITLTADGGKDERRVVFEAIEAATVKLPW